MCYSLLRVSTKGAIASRVVDVQKPEDEELMIASELAKEGVSKVEVFRAHHSRNKREIYEVIPYAYTTPTPEPSPKHEQKDEAHV